MTLAMGSATDKGGDEPIRFHSDRPSDLRVGRPYHRLGYIIDALPRALADLADDLQAPADGRVLDFGCADRPYRDLFPESVDYVGADLPGNPEAAVFIRPDGTVPLESASFDVLISTQVLEHVADPALYLAESFRLLRPGGRMLLSTHGLMVFHPDPVDYWRWTGAGLRRAVQAAGFEVERFEGIMGLGPVGLQLFQDSLYWRLPRPLRPCLALVMQALIRVFERLHDAEDRRMNALVFALVAHKP